jgi:predicted RNase H-like HicB family nuclease
MKYAVVYDKGPTSYGASVPDLPGCFAGGSTLEKARERIAGAIAMHIEVLAERGESVPEPSLVEFIEPRMPVGSGRKSKAAPSQATERP